MVVKSGRLDLEVKVDDSELEAVTAGIGETMEKLQRKALGVANVLAEIGKTKTAINNLAALAKEGTKAAGVLADMNAQLLAITKNERDAQRAFSSIKKMMEYKPAGGVRPPPGGAYRPDGLRPDLAPDSLRGPAGGKRLAGVSPSALPIVAAAFSPSVIGAVLNRYDPLLKDAADRYYIKNVDPRVNEYLLGITPGAMYGMTRAGIDRARGGYQEPPPRPDPSKSAAWRSMKGWGGDPLEGYPSIYYDSDVFRGQRDQQQQDPWGKHEFWAQKRYKRWRQKSPGAYQGRRVGTPEDPAELRIPRAEKWEWAEAGRTAGLNVRPTERLEETEESQLESLERIEEVKEEHHDRELERIQETSEHLANYVDPAPYIVEGLKSGEIRQAIDDFAVVLGTKVAEELVHKLVVLGIMAVLSLLTGGASQGATMMLGRGGVVKAGRGLLGVLPAKPGGHYIPWGNQLINAAEQGEAEALGIFPRGRAGQELILGPLARMFNIPVMPPNVMISPTATPAPEVSVETRPVNNITVNVTNADRHHIQAHNAANAGKVNKAVTVRK